MGAARAEAHSFRMRVGTSSGPLLLSTESLRNSVSMSDALGYTIVFLTERPAPSSEVGVYLFVTSSGRTAFARKDSAKAAVFFSYPIPKHH